MSVLLFDPDSSGHHSEYISHLADYLNENSHNRIFHFVVSANFKLQYENIVRKTETLENIKWHYLKDHELKHLQNQSILKRSFVEYNLMSKYARDLNAKTVHLLYFNVYQFALILKRPSFKIRGILFQQFTRMPKDGLKNRLKYLRKWLITKAYSLNPIIERIYVLNDEKSVNLLNKKFHTSIFSYLPDPVPILKPLENFDVHAHYNIPSHKKIILHFGALGKRKGTIEVVDSILHLTKKHKKELTLLLVGRFENENIEKLLKRKRDFHIKEDPSSLIMDNQFVSNAMMKSLFNQCFAVLIPYKNPEASSGILGHAIAAQKPVITTGMGLLKEIVEENRFGLLLESISPKQIAEGIMEITSKSFRHQGHENYLARHTPNEFAQTILD